MNKVIVMAGTRGTGKTDYSKEMAFRMMKVFPMVIIVDTFDSDVWRNMATYNAPERATIQVPIVPLADFPRLKKGVVRLISSDVKELLSVIEQYARNAYIIFEDSRKYIGDRLTDDSRNFILDSKQKNLDLQFNFHAVRRIPVELLDVADILILKKTNEPGAPKKVESWPEIKNMMAALKKDTNRFVTKALQLN